MNKEKYPSPAFAASHALGAAALAGLLSLAPACTSASQPSGTHDGGSTSTGGTSSTTSGGTSNGVSGATSAGVSGATSNGGTTSGGGGSNVGGADASVVAQGGTSGATAGGGASAGGATGTTDAGGPIVCDAAMEAGAVTSSAVVTDMTLELFTTQCDARGGVVEIHPHCGGANSCKGMSYDTGTMVLTEHSCRGMNACAGYSCIIC